MTLAPYPTELNDAKYDDDPKAKAIKDLYILLNGGIDSSNIAQSGIGAGQLSGGIGAMPGMISAYGGATAPGGWLLCDGASVLKVSYPALFTAIGTAYGTADSTHFNLPDLRGKVAAGMLSTDTDFHELGHAGGGKTHSHVTGGTSASHTHQQRIVNAGGTGMYGTIPSQYGGAGNAGYNTGGNNEDHTHSAGSGVADSTLQPHQTVNYIIKI